MSMRHSMSARNILRGHSRSKVIAMFVIWTAAENRAAPRIIRRTGGLAEATKDLAYRLFLICSQGSSHKALAYTVPL
jgi:hypothetical protein